MQYSVLTIENQENSEKAKILKEFENAKLEGYIGWIGDLGKIDKKFAVAVTTSCSANMDVLLFKQGRNVDEAISFLKKNNIGWANFISMDVLKWKPIKIPESPNANCWWMIDLIEMQDPEYKIAMEWAVWDTLVCPNYDLASEVNGYGDGHWVVTFDGVVFEKN